MQRFGRLIIGFMLGCSTVAQAQKQQDLVGTWTGTMVWDNPQGRLGWTEEKNVDKKTGLLMAGSDSALKWSKDPVQYLMTLRADSTFDIKLVKSTVGADVPADAHLFSYETSGRWEVVDRQLWGYSINLAGRDLTLQEPNFRKKVWILKRTDTPPP